MRAAINKERWGDHMVEPIATRDAGYPVLVVDSKNRAVLTIQVRLNLRTIGKGVSRILQIREPAQMVAVLDGFIGCSLDSDHREQFGIYPGSCNSAGRRTWLRVRVGAKLQGVEGRESSG